MLSATRLLHRSEMALSKGHCFPKKRSGQVLVPFGHFPLSVPPHRKAPEQIRVFGSKKEEPSWEPERVREIRVES